MYTDGHMHTCIDLHVNGYRFTRQRIYIGVPEGALTLASPKVPFGGGKESGFGKDYVLYSYVYMDICTYVCVRMCIQIDMCTYAGVYISTSNF